MAWALRRERIRYEMEDTGGCDWIASVPSDEPYVDALDHAVRLSNRPAGRWICDDCGQRWPGSRLSCGYCGHPRND